jgi:hypothetical protein
MGELPCFLGRVPNYEIVDDHMHIRLDGFALVMPIDVFQAGCARGEAAIAKWHLARKAKAETTVVQLGRLRT